MLRRRSDFFSPRQRARRANLGLRRAQPDLVGAVDPPRRHPGHRRPRRVDPGPWLTRNCEPIFVHPTSLARRADTWKIPFGRRGGANVYSQCRYQMKGEVSAMRTRVQRWGNSLAVRIPLAFGRELHLQPESTVDMTVESGRLVLVPVPDSTVPTLAELIERVTDENRHTEIWTGAPRGNEAW
jgi:antitoxin MazE